MFMDITVTDYQGLPVDIEVDIDADGSVVQIRHPDPNFDESLGEIPFLDEQAQEAVDELLYETRYET